MHLLLSTTYLWDFYRVKISIALLFQSLDPIRSLDRSLFTRLIAPYIGLTQIALIHGKR